MKNKKPEIPKGAPEGTVWSGGPIDDYQKLGIQFKHFNNKCHNNWSSKT
jgi:hypothetical protein